jgi:hypothetical protein
MANYLIYDTEDDAKDRSRTEWENVLGRPKNPEDVTEFLNPWRVGLDGRTALDMDGIPYRGTDENNIVDVLPEDNWPPPIVIEG